MEGIVLSDGQGIKKNDKNGYKYLKASLKQMDLRRRK